MNFFCRTDFDKTRILSGRKKSEKHQSREKNDGELRAEMAVNAVSLTA